MDAVKPISPRAERLLSEYNLGHVRAEYKGHWPQRGLLSIVLFPLGLLLLFVSISNVLFPMDTPGVNWHWFDQLVGLIQWVSRLMILMVGSCFTLLGLVFLILLVGVLWQRQQRVYLGEKGFIAARRRVETAVRWEAVREMRRSVLFVTFKKNKVQQILAVNTYMIIPDEGKECSISAEPGPEIEQAVTACQLPRALESYQAGKTLSFDWLTLDQQGLHLTPETIYSRKLAFLAKLPGGGRALPKLQGLCVASDERFLPWEKLACYWIDESSSTLVLSKKGERKHWAMVPLYQVANPALCLALMEHILYADTREIA